MTSSTSLLHYLRPVMSHLDKDGVTEILINRPGECFVERHGEMHLEQIPCYDYNYLCTLAGLVAGYNSQHINKSAPLLSATLPGGGTNPNCAPSGMLERPGDHGHTQTLGAGIRSE